LTGFWATPDIYQSVTGLPVLRSLRTITASIIRDRLLDIGKQKILSIGLGTGVIYKHVLKEQINQGKLGVMGLDVSHEMVDSFVKEIRLPTKKLLGLKIPNYGEVLVSHHNILDGLSLPESSFDIVEAVLVLHHINYSHQLKEISKMVYKLLKKGGVFIIGDIDLNIGSYIEKKEEELKSKYTNVYRDTEKGCFNYSLMNGKSFSIPILDKDDNEDKKVIANMMQESFNYLRDEAVRFGSNDSVNAINVEIESALKGCELNRQIDDWIEIVKTGFGHNSQIDVLPPNQIRKMYPDVLDRPFILSVIKK
jgi:SAM-dependent methyltransferase